jgi:hypothetical protein
MVEAIYNMIFHRLANRKGLVVERHNIYAGYLTENDENGTFIRGILFKVDNNGYVEDLIYNAPLYRIQNIQGDVKNSIVITRFVQLEPLLKYLNVNERLTQAEVNQLFRTLFRDKTLLDEHSYLFGIRPLSKFAKHKEPTNDLPIEIYNTLSYIMGSNIEPNGKEYTYVRNITKKR